MPTERQIHRRRIDPSNEEVNTALLRIVADLEECEMEELPSFWMQVDSLVDDLFSDPPSADANAQVIFTYAGYRIAVEQNGDVELLKQVDSPETEQ